MTTEHTSTEGAPGPIPPAETGRPQKRGWLIFLRDVVVIILVAVLVSLVIKTFVVRSFYIPSGSMEDTLLIKDRILVDEITPRFGDYERGDVVVFRDPGGWLPPSTDPPRHPMVEAGDWLLSLVGLSARTPTTTSSSGSSACRVTTSSAATRSGRSPSTAFPSTSPTT